MSFFNKLFKTVKKTVNQGVKLAGKGLKQAMPVFKAVGKEVGGIVKTGLGAGKNIIGGVGNLGKNAGNLLNPGNLMLYAGLFIVGIVMLPKILDSGIKTKQELTN